MAEQSPAVWKHVMAMMQDGWFGRVKSYYESKWIAEKRAYADIRSRTHAIPNDWLTMECAVFCQSLGAPVGRFFTAAAIIVRNDGGYTARTPRD
jgi:hypothetical protein